METNQTAPEADSETPGSGPVPEVAMGSTDAAGAADATSRSAAAGPHADGAVGSAPDPSRDAHGGDPADRAAGPGFTAWLRRLGVPRRAGWLGGVCAGVGARIGVDPIIVRGIVVVIAVLGAPFVLVYAIAWLLLPDTEGEIHLERLTHGTVDPAVVGIAVMGVIGFIPLVQGGWLGWLWWPEWPLPIGEYPYGAPLRIVWTLAVVGAIVALVVWLVRRASQNAPAGGAERVASAPAAGPGHPSRNASPASPPDGDGSATPVVTGTALVAGAAVAGTAVAGTAVAAPPAAEPPIPPMGADADEIAEWRARQAEWRESQAAWKGHQAESAQAARQLAAEENRARSLEFQAKARAARDARRAARPRASAAFVFTMLGIALVAGAAAAIWALGNDDTAAYALPIAFAVMTLVLAIGMVVAALWRRRSGWLATLTVVSLVGMSVGITASSLAPFGTLIGPGASVSLGYPQTLMQPVGDAYLSIGSYDSLPNTTQLVTLTQGSGDAYLAVGALTSIVVDATEAGDVELIMYDANGGMLRRSLGDTEPRVFTVGGKDGFVPEAEPADARLVLRQGTGSMLIEIQEG